jgi:hypothetical protein
LNFFITINPFLFYSLLYNHPKTYCFEEITFFRPIINCPRYLPDTMPR